MWVGKSSRTIEIHINLKVKVEVSAKLDANHLTQVGKVRVTEDRRDIKSTKEIMIAQISQDLIKTIDHPTS